MVEPVEIEFHPVTGFPPEYCEFVPKGEFEKCLPWLLENRSKEWLQANCQNYSAFFADEPEDAVREKLEKLSVAGARDKKTEDGEIVKKLPGGKVKKKEKPEVILERSVRNKRKCITTIRGMETFDIKLPEAAKLFGKRFACGSSVVKGPADKEQIDVQGDFLEEIADLILEKWEQITEKDMYLWENNKKVPMV
ncbi:hypothetical protein CYMTET_29102 [Cymbomonas tetramitiformis]|uniref:Translation machinery-associated protein 22 n=1 Tax=Cymbomonas tetramitiformis TaxID=36881 RepID=A0AAE0KV89_9CHLO|nr:hypothetical protein CYMTET_29102 [Cymbomonas tetramitiformis]|eukprot:gene26882-33048_t